jgi:uncharacterized iron-regulated membrane protein
MTSRARSWLRHLHRWLGLGLGVPFLVLGLSGSLLVFYIEIDRALNPEIQVDSALPAPGWSSPVWDRALATARAQWPQAQGRWSFEVTDRAGAIPARYYPPDDHGHGGGWTLFWLSPDATAVLRQATWGDTLMTWFYDLHRNLLMGESGNQLVGWLGFVTLVMSLTGLAVWWPRGSWRKALAFKRGASAIRRIHDLHKLFGLASLLLLVILSGTGALLGLPAVKSWLLERTLAPVVSVPSPQSRSTSGQQIPIARALAVAHAALPGARLTWIDVPGPGAGVFRFRVRVPGDPTQRFPHSLVFVDQYTGEVLAVQDLRQGTASSTVNAWIRPLHDASVGGLATRILGVIAGLVPLGLLVTGFLRWRLRRAARAHLSARI